MARIESRDGGMGGGHPPLVDNKKPPGKDLYIITSTGKGITIEKQVATQDQKATK